MYPAKRKLLAYRKSESRDIGAVGNFSVVLGLWFTAFLMIFSFWSAFDPIDKKELLQVITSDFGVFIFSAPIVITGYVISSGKVRATSSGLNATMLIGFIAGTGFCYKIDLVPKLISDILSHIPLLVQNWLVAIVNVVLIITYVFKRKSFDSWVEKNFRQ